MEITRETYIKADDDTHRGMNYDLLAGLHKKFDEHLGVCEHRFTKIEKHKKLDKIIAGGGGVVGGIIGYCLNLIGLGK